MVPPIRIHRLSPSPDLDAEFTAQPDFQERVQAFLDEIGNNFPLSPNRQPDPPAMQPDPTGHQQPEAAASPQRAPEGHPTGSPSTPNRQTTSPEVPIARAGRRPLFQLNPNLFRPRTNSASATQTISRSQNLPPLTGDENLTTTSSQRPSLAHSRGPKSRQKRKCTFGPKLKSSADRAQVSPGPQRSPSPDAQYLEALLREIDAVCQTDQPSTSHRAETSNAATAQVRRDTYRNPAARRCSRPKAKCRFGPYSRARRQLPDAQAAESPAIPPPPDQQAHTPSAATLIVPYPDRVTLTPPTLRSHSPFARYYPTAPEAPRLNPNRFALARLGISEETLARRAAQEASEAV